MAVNLSAPQALLPVGGVELAATAAGIRYRDRDDLVLLRFAPGTQVAGVFTRNAFCAAPVTLCRQHLDGGTPIRAVLINAGNANAGTGSLGMQRAEESCAITAAALEIDAQAVLPLSTGVIGQTLPIEPFAAAVPKLAEHLDEGGWLRAAHAIMTTDTVAKGVSRQLDIDGRSVTVTGIAKGAGMIRPDMATMLAVIATDAAVTPMALQSLLGEAVNHSFNAITVDGDTSTNDSCLLAATGAAGNVPLEGGNADLARLALVITEVCQLLAQACVRDAEGATRFITVQVDGARDLAEARRVAYAVAESPLVKTAAFAGDPNWGRILAAVGRSGVGDLDVGRIDLRLDDVTLLRGGEPTTDYTEERGAAVAGQAEFTIGIDLHRGATQATVWTCDYSYDYVRINAEYRS